jgi:glycosyltransferase involved in cell wall biosynthesis
LPNVSPRPPLKLLACSGSLDGGGSERQLWQLVSRLDRGRFAPEVYLLHKRGPYLDQLPTDVPVHAFDVDHPSPPRFPPGRISRLQSRHLRRVVQSRGIDIVYDRTFHMSLLTGWALPARQPRVSVIVSPPSRDLPSTERRWLSIKRTMLKRAYQTATCTICVSSEVADDAALYYRLNRDRLTVLQNPVDVDTVRRLAASSDHCGVARDPSQQDLHIALVGRFTAEKGHSFAIEVLRTMRGQQCKAEVPVHLHCVGDGPLKSEIQSLVANEGLDGVVHIHGYKTNPYPLMTVCDLVFVPSRYEGFPNVAMEAMALGVPLLMTDYGPTARMIAGANEERAKLLPLENVPLAVQAIVDRVGNAETWRKRALAAKAWIEREHALAPWLEKMMSLLERAASGSAGRT